VATYKALGGGWEVRRGQPLLPEDVAKEMRRRADWWSFWGRSQLKPIREE
jgi:hypothetical protein